SESGDRPRIIVAELLQVASRDGEDDSRHHPVERIGETDQPHLARCDPFVNRISMRVPSRDPAALLPGEPKRSLIEHVNVEATTGIDDPQVRPRSRELVVEDRGLAVDFLELPVAERQSLVAAHLGDDVAMNWTIDVFWIEVEREFLSEEESAPPRVRVIETGLSGRREGRVEGPVIVPALRERFRTIGAQPTH